jgi:cell division protein FtsN
VLAGAYLPDFLLETVEQTVAVNEPQSRQPVQFEFDQRLRRSEVRTDPNTYADDVNPTAGMTIEYLIQAASFRTRDDADSLRAQLLLIDLPARTNAVEVGDKPWYRVTVGPFLSQVEAGRAMTRLREQNLDAFLIKREL